MKEKIAALKKRMEELKEIEVLVQFAPDKQISLTDDDRSCPDSQSELRPSPSPKILVKACVIERAFDGASAQ